MKSLVLHKRFMADFPEAIVDDFQMLYAIANRHSKVSSKRFYRMFRDVGAPIKPASSSQTALFDEKMIEGVYACTETSFDYKILRKSLQERLERSGIDIKLNTSLVELRDQSGSGVVATLSDGSEITARYAFNVTYAQINDTLSRAKLPQTKLKHELAELALIEPPADLEPYGITVMDGPFFSCMPYPSENLYSLTHVRYTPHDSWTDDGTRGSAYDWFSRQTPETRVQYMIRDAKRFLPCLHDATYVKSIYDVKTVLQKNERDDGRPILYRQSPPESRVISILGGKIDNIYDLFDLVRQTSNEFADAHTGLVLSSTQGSDTGAM